MKSIKLKNKAFSFVLNSIVQIFLMLFSGYANSQSRFGIELEGIIPVPSFSEHRILSNLKGRKRAFFYLYLEESLNTYFQKKTGVQSEVIPSKDFLREGYILKWRISKNENLRLRMHFNMEEEFRIENVDFISKGLFSDENIISLHPFLEKYREAQDMNKSEEIVFRLLDSLHDAIESYNSLSIKHFSNRLLEVNSVLDLMNRKGREASLELEAAAFSIEDMEINRPRDLQVRIWSDESDLVYNLIEDPSVMSFRTQALDTPVEVVSPPLDPLSPSDQRLHRYFLETMIEDVNFFGNSSAGIHTHLEMARVPVRDIFYVDEKGDFIIVNEEEVREMLLRIHKVLRVLFSRRDSDEDDLLKVLTKSFQVDFQRLTSNTCNPRSYKQRMKIFLKIEEILARPKIRNEDLKSFISVTRGRMIDKKSKYHAVNFESLITYGTLELRFFDSVHKVKHHESIQKVVNALLGLADGRMAEALAIDSLRDASSLSEASWAIECFQKNLLELMSAFD